MLKPIKREFNSDPFALYIDLNMSELLTSWLQFVTEWGGIMWYIVSFFAGVLIGALAVCLCVVSADADKRSKL